jgi:succinate dehydrogenase/fumarate reductase-like Fe-S protein
MARENRRSEGAQAFVDGFQNKLTRQSVLSLASCVHCGMCNDSCHYYLTTGESNTTPAAKVDKVRKLFNYHSD